MSLTQSRRDALVECLADHVLAHGLGSASLRSLAAAADTSDRMLLYYFPDKAALVAAVLDRIAHRMMAILSEVEASSQLSQADFEHRLLPIVLDDTRWPFMQLWLEIASIASRGDSMYRQVGERIARGFLAWTANQLLASSDAERQELATRALMTVEGAVLLKSLGLGDAVASVTTGRV